jgi:putative membrane protein
MNTDRPKKPFEITVKFPLFVIAALVISVATLAQISPTTQKKTIEVAPTDSSAKEKLTDSSFVEKAALAGLAEVEISKLAVAKSSNKKIDKFAANMIKDHESANTKLKQLATANRLSIPNVLSAEQKKILADLNNLAGEDFDRAYVDLMKKNHDTTVALFDNAAGEATLNPDFRVFANKTLPLLREHQKHAHALVNTTATSLTQTKKPSPKQ